MKNKNFVRLSNEIILFHRITPLFQQSHLDIYAHFLNISKFTISNKYISNYIFLEI